MNLDIFFVRAARATDDDSVASFATRPAWQEAETEEERAARLKLRDRARPVLERVGRGARSRRAELALGRYEAAEHALETALDLVRGAELVENVRALLIETKAALGR